MRADLVGPAEGMDSGSQGIEVELGSAAYGLDPTDFCSLPAQKRGRTASGVRGINAVVVASLLLAAIRFCSRLVRRRLVLLALVALIACLPIVPHAGYGSSHRE